ncbi:hypothetical protein BC826DRAFT_1090384 [Russula brevipes]|nr:hypothetical protein BC826DRAFT_1090384 [Russula brevipes]
MHFTLEQKQQLLANLDIEVAHRTRQLESWLSDTLAAFRNRHERQLAYIPHLVRGMTMAEFGDKYDGDVQAALRGLQKERLTVDVAPIDRNAMKRKWAPPPDEEPDRAGKHPDNNHGRAAKNPRIAPPSPQKKPPPLQRYATPSRIHAPKTPGTVPSPIAPSPSPHKIARIPSAPLIRAGSPTKPTAASLARQVQVQARVPSSSSFKPAIPKGAPTYPPPPRRPRKDETMLSINGSPLANPYDLGLGWLADAPDDDAVEETDGEHQSDRTMALRPGRSRSTSQAQHSRSDLRTAGPGAVAAASNPGHMSARVAVPTRDGHLLEFDPLLTSPRALDKLEGITDSAKKQAREDMSKLVQAAVAKWNVK